MRPEAVAAAVEPSGLTLVRVAEIPPYHYASIFEKVRSCPVIAAAPYQCGDMLERSRSFSSTLLDNGRTILLIEPLP
jgi:hypothetical protein